jgi:hypothetical protein
LSTGDLVLICEICGSADYADYADYAEIRVKRQITLVPSAGATPVPFSEAAGQAGQAQMNADWLEGI